MKQALNEHLYFNRVLSFTSVRSNFRISFKRLYGLEQWRARHKFDNKNLKRNGRVNRKCKHKQPFHVIIIIIPIICIRWNNADKMLSSIESVYTYHRRVSYWSCCSSKVAIIRIYQRIDALQSLLWRSLNIDDALLTHSHNWRLKKPLHI